MCYGGGIAMVGSTFVENYETEQPILELARFMNMAQQKAAGQDTDMSDSSELYQVRAVACMRARPCTAHLRGGGRRERRAAARRVEKAPCLQWLRKLLRPCHPCCTRTHTRVPLPVRACPAPAAIR